MTCVCVCVSVIRPPPSLSEATSLVNPTNYRVCSTQPIDLAAHMVLLGESLAVIGQKLRDHDVSTPPGTAGRADASTME